MALGFELQTEKGFLVFPSVIYVYKNRYTSSFEVVRWTQEISFPSWELVGVYKKDYVGQRGVKISPDIDVAFKKWLKE